MGTATSFTSGDVYVFESDMSTHESSFCYGISEDICLSSDR